MGSDQEVGASPDDADGRAGASIRYDAADGEKGISLDAPPGWVVHTRVPSWPARGMADREIFDALALPFSPGKGTLFIINDLDRPTPTKRILSMLARRYPGAPAGTILVATGAHRITDPADAVDRALLGDLSPSFGERFFIHDAARDPTVQLGTTSRGTPVEVSQQLLEYETVVAIGSIEPHWFAGYTGGRKSLVPGIAAFETIRHNHRLASHTGAAPLETLGNPVHEDLMEAARLAIARHAGRYLSDTGISFINAVGRGDSVFSLVVGPLNSPEGLSGHVDAIYRKGLPPTRYRRRSRRGPHGPDALPGDEIVREHQIGHKDRGDIHPRGLLCRRPGPHGFFRDIESVG